MIRTRQPIGFARANPALNLTHLYWAGGCVGGPGSLVRDATGRENGSFGVGTGSISGNTLVLDGDGPFIKFDNTGTGSLSSVSLALGSSGSAGMPDGNVFTLLASVNLTLVSEESIYGPGEGQAAGGIYFRVNAGGTLELIKSYIASLGASSSAITANKWYSIALSYDGTTTRYYIDGVAAGTGSGGYSFDRMPHALGVQRGMSYIQNGGKIRYFGVASRPLSQAEIWGVAKTPWSALFAPSRRVWVQLEPASGVQDATVNATGVTATAALGTPTVTTSGTITVNATGVSATTALGTTTQTYSGSVTETGLAATTALGTVSVTSSCSVAETGVSATTALGTTTQTYTASVAETGVAATGQLGTTTQTYSGQVAATGVSTTSALGTVSVTTTAGVTVSPTGVAATTALGTVSTTYTASVAETGLAATGQLGTVSVTTTASVNVSATGVSATSALGTVSATTTASVTVNATGVVATSAVGTVSASGVSPQVAAPTADIAAGGWTSSLGGALYAAVDETTQNDSDYIYSPNNPTTEQFEIMFASLVDPQSSAGHTIRLGLQAIGQDTTFTFKLVQGTTVLDTWTESVTAGATATRPHTLSGIVADSITNYSDLRLRGSAGP
jgi:hypothetical protein